MTKLFDTMLLVLICFIIALSAGGCRQTPPSPASPTPNPSVAPPKSLPWAEMYGRFYTRDLARAQEEIPFRIILPSYVPDKRKDAPPPGIDGPLRGYQYDDEVEIHVLYHVDLGGEVLGTIQISESNYPVLPGDPKLNPKYEAIEIRDKRLIKTEGNFSLGPGFFFFFDDSSIYFVVELYYFSYEEAIKIVESMITQIE